MKPTILTFLFAALLVGSSLWGKTHLFILSGQSTMAGLKPDVSFTPTVKKLLASWSQWEADVNLSAREYSR